MGKANSIRQASKFYSGKACIVTGRPTHNHWHHLDENHVNWTPANIVPVEPNINHDIEQLRKSSSTPMSKDIYYDHLRATSREHYALGRFAECYACNRLGSFVAIKYENDPDLSLQFAIEALHALRPLANTACAHDFAEDTLRRNILPVVCRQANAKLIRTETVFALCKEIASYFLDHGEYTGFSIWVSLANMLIKHGVEDTAAFEIQRNRLSQHVALAALATGNTRFRSKLKQVDRLMDKRRYTFGISTNAQHLALSYVTEGLVDEGEEIIKQTEKKFGQIEPLESPGTPRHLGGYSWWTYPRLLLVRADIQLLKKKDSWTKEYVDGALDIIRSRRIRALGASPFHSLQCFREYFPNDARLMDSQTGGCASLTYKKIAGRIFNALRKRIDSTT